MNPRLVVSITAIVLFFSVSASSQTTTPDAVVRSFYAYSNARSSTFTRRHIELRKKWYTPQLYRAFLKQLAEDQAYLKTHPTDKPFFGDGLAFRPLDEACYEAGRSYGRSHRISKTQITNSRAEVEVKFAYPAACKSGGEPIIYKLILRKLAGKWLIDDWAYDDGHTLVGDMKAHSYDG